MFNHPDNEQLRHNIAETFANDFAMLERVKNLSEKVFKHDAIAWHEKDDFSKSALLFGSIIVVRVQAIELLCRAGFAQNAIMILRAMFEELVTLKYMRNDKTRIKDFVDFDNYERMHLGQMALDNPQFLTGEKLERAQKRQEELVKAWDAVKAKFTRQKDRVFQRWSGKNLRGMCEDPVDVSNYDYAYTYLSKYVHPSLLTADEYILGRDGDNVVVQIGANPRLVPETIRSTAIIFHNLLAVLNDEYKMGFDNELNAIADMSEERRKEVNGEK